MKKVINFVTLAAIMTAGLVASSQANQLDDLLKQVKADRVSEAKLDKKNVKQNLFLHVLINKHC